MANTMTAVVIIAMLFTAEMKPATSGSFTLYTCIIYLGFPLTVISNMTTGPMLDRITPVEKKTVIQGVMVSLVEGIQATFNIVLGLVADQNGNSYLMWICFSVSIAAAIVNLPLVFDPMLGKTAADRKDKAVPEDIDEDTN